METKPMTLPRHFCLQNCQSRSKMNLPWQANTMPRSKKSRRLYNAVANMHNCSLAPQTCSHLTRSTTTNRNKTTLSRPPTTTTPRRLPQEKSNEDSKEIADTATYWATSGSNATNAQTPQGRSQRNNEEITTTSPTWKQQCPTTRNRKTTIQLQTCMPNLWQDRTFRTGLQRQDTRCIGLPKCTI